MQRAGRYLQLKAGLCNKRSNCGHRENDNRHDLPVGLAGRQRLEVVPISKDQPVRTPNGRERQAAGERAQHDFFASIGFKLIIAQECVAGKSERWAKEDRTDHGGESFHIGRLHAQDHRGDQNDNDGRDNDDDLCGLQARFDASNRLENGLPLAVLWPRDFRRVDDDFLSFFRDFDRRFALGAGAQLAGEFFADLKAGLTGLANDVDGHWGEDAGDRGQETDRRSFADGGGASRLRMPLKRWVCELSIEVGAVS